MVPDSGGEKITSQREPELRSLVARLIYHSRRSVAGGIAQFIVILGLHVSNTHRLPRIPAIILAILILGILKKWLNLKWIVTSSGVSIT